VDAYKVELLNEWLNNKLLGNYFVDWCQ